MEQPVARNIKQDYICSDPKASFSFKFLEDDFSLIYSKNGRTRTFTKKDANYDGEKYIFKLKNSLFFVDESTHKIFCNRFLSNHSVSFDAIDCFLIINEIVCGDLVNLHADNIAITGILTSAAGAIINAIGSLEILGTIDSPQLMLFSEQMHALGRIIGKNLFLSSDSTEFEKNSLMASTNTLRIKSLSTNLNESSLISDNLTINSENFESVSSVIKAENSFKFNGSDFQLKEQSNLIVFSSADIISNKFQIQNSKAESDNFTFLLSSSGESFLNLESEILALDSMFVSAKGSLRNENGKIEVKKLINLKCELFSNLHGSLIEGGQTKITAINLINHTSIIRSLLGETEFNLSMNGDEFIPNTYAHTNSKGRITRSPEDTFIGKRYSEIGAKFPPKNSDTSKSKEEEKSEGYKETSNTDNESAENKEDKNEIGSLFNYSGEIISAKGLKINSSGSLYNIAASQVKATDEIEVKLYGRVLNKNESSINTDANISITAKTGLICFENGSLKSNKLQMSSVDNCFDEFSILEGSGSLSISAEKFINRGLVQYAQGINIQYSEFDNSGKIVSEEDINTEALHGYPAKSFTNEDGEIISDKKISIESPNVKLGGKIKAADFFYKLHNPKPGKYTFFIAENIVNANAVYDFGNSILRMDADLNFQAPATLLCDEFFNRAIIKSKAPLTINARVIQNGYEHNLKSNIKQFNGYNLHDCEYDFKEDGNISISSNDNIYIRPEMLNCAAAILGEDTLTFEANGTFYNSGIVESRNKIILKGNKIQTGWGSWSQRTISLPFVEGARYRYNCHDGVFDFPYDFFTPQKSIIRSFGDIEIDCDKFISSFGNVQANGSLHSNTKTLFLNYAGNISLGKDSHIKSSEFVNSIGTMATSERGLRYWKISAATTDPATLICTGILHVDVAKYFKNRASYLSATGDMFLNGKLATNQLRSIDSRFVNQSTGTEYFRMYTISGVDVTTTSRRCLGIGCGSTTTTTYWWQDINEIVKDDIIRAAISSAQNLVLQGFSKATNTGVISAQSIYAKEIGSLGFSHGDQSKLEFAPIPEFRKTLTIETAINKSDLFSDYLFVNPIADEPKIPFVIIDDGSINSDDLQKAKPAITIPEYAQVMYREMLRNYSTSRLSDMPTFEEGAKLAAQNSQNIGTAVNLPNFAKAATSMIKIKPSEVKFGIYFRPYRYTEKYCGQITLFPELYLSDASLNRVLRDP